MSTLISFLSGGAVVASLFGLSPETLQMLIGIAAGTLLALAVLFAYVLLRLPSPQPRKRKTVRKADRRIVTSVPYVMCPA